MGLERTFDKFEALSDEQKLDKERRELRREIDDLRHHADQLESRFDEIARARARIDKKHSENK